MVFDDAYINWNDSDFTVYYSTDFYGRVQEDIPLNAPTPLGKAVQLNVFVNANHARNKITRRSQTGIIIYLNKALILWYSKSQKTVETSTFGSEFVAFKVATNMVKGLSIPIEGPANVLVDNKNIMKNSTIPSSTLQGKHNAICYHYVREAVTSNIMKIAHIPSEQNLADMFTKMLGATKLHVLCQQILY